MKLLALIFPWLVAVEHVYIWILECFLLTTDYGKKTFRIEGDVSPQVETLFFNQGFYNLFLAAGLIWALVWIKDKAHARSVQYFFLGCVAVAGIVGSMSITRIIFIQTVPAVLAMLFIFLAAKDE